MKQSWIIGSVSLWLLILGWEMMATGGTGFSAATQTAMNSLWTVDFTNFSGATSALATLMTNVGTYLTVLVQIIFLWSPTVWSGNWVWFWIYVCFPISVSFIVSILFIAKGGHAS